mmetsp:Transcript_13115/g.11594  ORF Transcript_13115/g.11594 Transcript_13115/m.11594 type:complete len:158 (+) Transcript_13115:204-677(+)|eukprot:CAMPEP_0205807736 /NCGR_PEP_ID=MMETSP0205-20121125/11503_1 /ASSEMBLY_ACC=CAM_ASM_000278 /TAXON_ID=36767 /ORGANISM="Euplotes focardii, Strain TN1" /LENGTH=157 /DNA_ID=CAMNT_0053082339 /DNA_START=919 /DNA_END=1392 /DNA_ORIENTATION=-
MNTNTNKRAYQQIDLWKRKELIESVNKKEETMKDAAKRLGINYCTAKHIMKVFRRSGSYETDLMRKKKQKEHELREKVLNDHQFAEMTTLKSIPQKPVYQGEISQESTHHNLNEHSQETPFIGNMHPAMMNRNILFNPIAAQSSMGQYNFDIELNNV